MEDDIDQAANDLPPEWLSDSPVSDPPKRSALRELAAEPGSELVELADGVWWQPKQRPDRDKLS